MKDDMIRWMKVNSYGQRPFFITSPSNKQIHSLTNIQLDDQMQKCDVTRS